MKLTRYLAPVVLALPAPGQTLLSGLVHDGAGGPLLSGQVYHADFTITVPVGETLTIQPGAILKMGGTAILDVGGTLDSLPGGATSHITSLLDDSLGGDTNGDGASAGTNGDWLCVRSNGGTVELDNTRLSFGGGSIYSPVYCQNGVARVRDCVIDGSLNSGVDVNGWDVEVVVENTRIENCASYAINDIRLDQVPGLLNNTAVGNGSDAVRVAVNGLDANTTIGVANLLGDVLVNPWSRTVPAGLSLELGPGVVVKNTDDSPCLWTVSGTLRLSGTEADPVVFTSIHDDSFGGDTVKDGGTNGAPGDWSGVRYLTDGLLHAEHALMRYAGEGNYSGFYSQAGRLEASHCAVEFGSGPGLDLNGWEVACEVSACRFDNNSGVAVEQAPIAILSGFDSNTASGNLGGDYVACQPWNLLESATVGPRNLINGSLVIPSGFAVVDGAELTLEAGTAFKFAVPSAYLQVNGRLTARGTASAPVFFSSLQDDTLGGDTNGDGLSFGDKGDWRGISSSSATDGGLDLEHVLIRNGGASNLNNLHLGSGIHRLSAVRSESSIQSGFYFSGNQALTTVTNCIALNNDFAGFETSQCSVPIEHATAYGNTNGIFASIDVGTSVRNSVIWGNGQDIVEFASTLAVSYTTSSNGPAGIGNSALDPLFVDAPNGDLRLALGSPAVDSADNAVAIPIGTDAVDAPRLLAPSGLGNLVADRGAFEQSRWSLSMTGAQAIGEPVALRLDGEAGAGVLLFSPQLANFLLEPAGVLLISPIGLTTLATVLVGADFVVPIPNNTGFIGLELGIQGYAVLGADPSQAQLTDRERLRIEPALP